MIRDPEKHTPIQRFRLATDLWQRFGEVAGDRARSAVLAEFVRWYLREPGAKMPKRPDTSHRRVTDRPG